MNRSVLRLATGSAGLRVALLAALAAGAACALDPDTFEESPEDVAGAEGDLQEADTATYLTGSWSSIAGSYSHTVALKGDGTVWTWGDNARGQLGDGTTIARYSPAQVPGLSAVAAIATSYDHAVVRRSDGTAWAWGGNDYGQLGNGTTSQRTSPVQVSAFSAGSAIAAGRRHTIARKSDGTVWAWGLNDDGQLGNGTTTDRSTPVQVSGLSL